MASLYLLGEGVELDRAEARRWPSLRPGKGSMLPQSCWKIRTRFGVRSNRRFTAPLAGHHMGSGRQPIIFLLGPSGAGKSTLAAWLADDDNLLHIEIDQFPADGIDAAGLRAPWNAFYLNGQPRALADEIRARMSQARKSGAVLSFPSLLILPPPQLASLVGEGVGPMILYGSGSECLDSFLRREDRDPRVPAAGRVQHWICNNRDSYVEFSQPEYSAFRLEMFKNGRHRPRRVLRAEVRRRVAG